MPMSHAYHPNCRNYEDAQVLVEGCAECEWRGQHPAIAIQNMDDQTLVRACERARDWARGDLRPSEPERQLFAIIGPLLVRLKQLELSV